MGGVKGGKCEIVLSTSLGGEKMEAKYSNLERGEENADENGQSKIGQGESELSEKGQKKMSVPSYQRHKFVVE